jgi:hypothetical protein
MKTISSLRLKIVLRSIAMHDEYTARLKVVHDDRRAALMAEINRLIAAGQKPDDPIGTYVMLFASSQGPERQAAVEAQLRKIDAGLKAHAGEPVLLVQPYATPSRPDGAQPGLLVSALPVLHLGLLGKGSLIFDFADPTHITLPTIKHVVSALPGTEKIEVGPMPIPDYLLGSLLEPKPGLKRVELAIGYEQVMQCDCRLMSENGSGKLEKLAQKLGIGLLETEDV